MRKILATAVLAAFSFGATAATTNEGSSITVGYAQGKVSKADFKQLKGVNVKYRYEWNEPVSVIGSFTYISGKESVLNTNEKLANWALSAGPAYRFNEFVSVYGLLGLANTKHDYNGISLSSSASSTTISYGLGVQFNPTPEWVIDVAYEGSNPKLYEENHTVNSFHIGAGYRF